MIKCGSEERREILEKGQVNDRKKWQNTEKKNEEID